MALPEPTISLLMNARHLYYMAKRELESGQTIRLFAGINLLHDAVEGLLWAIASHTGTARDRSEITQLYDGLNEHLSPKKLSFRPAVLSLNKVRIASKHYGICPDRKEANRLLTSMTEFLRETTESVFDANFMTVSLLDLLDDNKIRETLAVAQAAFDSKKYLSCLIDCRKVVYLLFEQWYDVEKFRRATEGASGILFAYSKAPFYTRNLEWIERNVNDPFQYIQIDHDALDKDLLMIGIETNAYWNIWRGTPAVYRYATTTEWLIKRDLRVEVSATEEHAAYILEQTLDIALQVGESRRRVRQLHRGDFYVFLARDGVNVYTKADRSSSVAAVTEPGLRQITVTEETTGLNDNDRYWKVSHVVDHAADHASSTSGYYFGYVHNDDIDWSQRDRTLPDSDTKPK